jgi:RimJ/RimL family protein N-acetyltransferase
MPLPDESRGIEIRYPAGINLYLVYRWRGRPECAVVPEGFRMIATPLMQPQVLAALARAWGLARLGKALAKLATPRRFLFCVMRGGRLAAHGWITRGLCRKYDIEQDACVIGPIHTDPQWRGRGLIVEAMRAAMAWLDARGCVLFYIDAHVANHASHRAIVKAGFEGPVAAVPHVPR